MSYKTPDTGTHTQDTISLWETIPKSDKLKTPETRTHTQDTKIWLCCKENLYHYITMSKHYRIRWVIKHLRQEHISKTQRYGYVVIKLISQNLLTKLNQISKRYRNTHSKDLDNCN